MNIMSANARWKRLNALLALVFVVGGLGGSCVPNAVAEDQPIWPPRYLAAAEVPLPQRVAEADVVVSGKVQEVEDKLVKAAYHADGKTKVSYQVVRFQVDEALLGDKERKEVRVGFVTRDSLPPGPGLYEAHGVEKDVDYILFLRKHPTEDFFVRCGPVELFGPKQGAELGKELKRSRRLVGIMKDPAAALKVDNATDRYLAVTMLIHRYRSPHPLDQKRAEKPIDAEVSKLLLRELAGADWKWDGNRLDMYPPHPYELFERLGVTAQDGYEPPLNADEHKKYAAAKAWVEDNQKRYTVKRFDTESK
jgi:hypothetical protein